MENFNKNNFEKVVQYIRLNQLKYLKEEVNPSNVNDFINEYSENLLHEAVSSKNYEIFIGTSYIIRDIIKDTAFLLPQKYEFLKNTFPYINLPQKLIHFCHI